jgi:hypothetical protein
MLLNTTTIIIIMGTKTLKRVRGVVLDALRRGAEVQARPKAEAEVGV